MAVREDINVYTENVRMVHYVESEHFGRVAIITIGAMMVGSIIITSTSGSPVKRLNICIYLQVQHLTMPKNG
jgi:phosphatidylserine decarboxylase